MRWAGHVARMEKAVVHIDLVGIPGEKRQHGRPRRRWRNNIKVDLQEIRWGLDWIDMNQDRVRWQALVKKVVNSLFP